MTVRLCLWSGPRNLSTAMMRSFGARADTGVHDEPFYAAYLAATGTQHPMREETLAASDPSPDAAATLCAGPAPGGEPIFYQKHIVHHLLPDFPRDWLGACRHAMLIREPERVLASYAAKREAVTLHDIAAEEQTALFDELTDRFGHPPPVIDSATILADPPAALVKLCAAFGIPYDDAMLSWEPGPKPEDGAWAPHWYNGVWKSSGFGNPPGPLPDLPPDFAALAREARPHYDRLAVHAL